MHVAFSRAAKTTFIRWVLQMTSIGSDTEDTHHSTKRTTIDEKHRLALFPFCASILDSEVVTNILQQDSIILISGQTKQLCVKLKVFCEFTTVC